MQHDLHLLRDKHHPGDDARDDKAERDARELGCCSIVAMPLFTLFGYWGYYLYGLFNQGDTFGAQFSPDNQ